MTDGTLAPRTDSAPRPHEPVALVDLLDRLLGAGVVLSGDITISIAGVDLVEIRLHALITSVRSEMRTGATHGLERSNP
jgi:hypothetical protein